MEMPKYIHTYVVVIANTIKELEVEVNQKLRDEHLLAGEFRIHQGKFYQPMMHSVFVGEPIKPETKKDEAKVSGDANQVLAENGKTIPEAADVKSTQVPDEN
jgi:hypothetical protein